jgi:hypothetical protein
MRRGGIYLHCIYLYEYIKITNDDDNINVVSGK